MPNTMLAASWITATLVQPCAQELGQKAWATGCWATPRNLKGPWLSRAWAKKRGKPRVPDQRERVELPQLPPPFPLGWNKKGVG